MRITIRLANLKKLSNNTFVFIQDTVSEDKEKIVFNDEDKQIEIIIPTLDRICGKIIIPYSIIHYYRIFTNDVVVLYLRSGERIIFEIFDVNRNVFNEFIAKLNKAMP